MGHLPVFVNSLNKAEEWLAELAAELGWDDRQHAYAALRATLHTLRDRLPVDEAADLAAQLPLLVRGIYFEGWNPSATPVKVRDSETFLEPVARALPWEAPADVERIVRAVFGLLARHVELGELTDVVRSLPAGIAGLFPGDVVARRKPRPSWRPETARPGRKSAST